MSLTVETVTDALADRVTAWLSAAMTKAKVLPMPETDLFTATLPPYRKFVGTGESESGALASLYIVLEHWALNELLAGRELPTWESAIPEVTPAARALVRISTLQHELKMRALQWGTERQNLPAGAVERCLADIDATVTRHAMAIQGVAPPARLPSLIIPLNSTSETQS